MNVKFLSAAVIATAAFMSANAFGQSMSMHATGSPVAQPPMMGYGYGYPYSYSSTLEEGILNGYANYNRSLGNYQRDYTEALRNYEQARTLNMRNNLEAYKTHLAAVDLRQQRLDGDITAAGEIKDQLNSLLDFVGDKVRRNELDGKVLMATIHFKDNASDMAQRWSTPTAGQAAPATVAAN